MNYLSPNIKFLRQQHTLKQEDIGDIVGKTRSLVSAWESDSRSITTEDIIKLSNYFNIPIDVLVGKDLRIEKKEFDELELLFDKAKPHLSDDDKETMKFLMQKTINNYEKSKNQGSD